MPTIQLTLDQLAEAIQALTPGELDTLALLLNPSLSAEIERASEMIRAGEPEESVSLENSESFRDV
jgi:uncharacterized protein YgbK (DUF1537 family)